MRRVVLAIAAGVAAWILGAVPAGASAAFTQCPAVDMDTSCQFLVTITNGGETITEDATQGPYEGSDDALIGVQNNSSSPVTSIHLSAEDELFGFETDGICDVGPPVAPGCKTLPFNSFKTKTTNAGKPCHFAIEERGETGLEINTEACAFPKPPGEPEGLTFGELIGIEGFYSETGDPATGYEGPTSWFSGIGALGSSSTGSGTVNFSPAIPPGSSTYFSLESPPAGGFGSASTLGTNLAGGGQSGASITVLQGTAVTDTATLTGANAPTATGAVSYNVFSDSACTKLVTAAGSAGIAAGVAGASSAESLAPGTYYWQASYPGDANNKAVASACGGEVLTVQAPTSTSTILSGGGVAGASIPVLVGTAVTDQAHIAGALAASATGTVTYTVFSDSKCTKPLASSSGPVTGGVGAPSAPFSSSKSATYYWTAIYSGGGLDAPSASACGSESLVVSKHANLGLANALPHGKKCFSKRAFPIHPKFPSGADIVRYEEFINGALVKHGSLHSGATFLSLIGLPKGTYQVELVTFTKSGGSFEDHRTFHTCVPKPKHKHKHK